MELLLHLGFILMAAPVSEDQREVIRQTNPLAWEILTDMEWELDDLKQTADRLWKDNRMLLVEVAEYRVLRRSSANGDFNGDGKVDYKDRAIFEFCATGPCIPYKTITCAGPDLDWDGDVDQEDWGLFQVYLGGS